MMVATTSYKLVVFDLDGSALTPEKQLTPRFKSAVKRALSQGVQIALASGRSLSSVLELMRQLPLPEKQGFAIACNGALIWSESQGCCIGSELLEHADVLALSALGQQLGYAAYFLENNQLMTAFPVTRGCGGYQYSHLPVVKLADGWQNQPRTSPKMMFIESEENINRLASLVPDSIYHRYHFVRSEPNYYEVMKQGVHKGAACKKLAAYLNIVSDDIIAVGDELNDKEMLLFAGLAVAMGNAVAEIKLIADWTTDSNQQDGAAKVLEYFVIKQ